MYQDHFFLLHLLNQHNFHGFQQMALRVLQVILEVLRLFISDLVVVADLSAAALLLPFGLEDVVPVREDHGEEVHISDY